MWKGRAQSERRCGRGEPSPSADVEGTSPVLAQITRMWEASLENAKQPSFGICSIRSIWLQVPSLPRARPRMYRREVWVAACNTALNLIEAHSHTEIIMSYSKQLLGGSNFK